MKPLGIRVGCLFFGGGRLSIKRYAGVIFCQFTVHVYVTGADGQGADGTEGFQAVDTIARFQLVRA